MWRRRRSHHVWMMSTSLWRQVSHKSRAQASRTSLAHKPRTQVSHISLAHKPRTQVSHISLAHKPRRGPCCAYMSCGPIDPAQCLICRNYGRRERGQAHRAKLDVCVWAGAASRASPGCNYGLRRGNKLQGLFIETWRQMWSIASRHARCHRF